MTGVVEATTTAVRVAEPATDRPRRKGGVVTTVVLAIAAAIWISPLLLLLITSVRPLADFISNGPLHWPKQFTGTNFEIGRASCRERV